MDNSNLAVIVLHGASFLAQRDCYCYVGKRLKARKVVVADKNYNPADQLMDSSWMGNSYCRRSSQDKAAVHSCLGIAF